MEKKTTKKPTYEELVQKFNDIAAANQKMQSFLEKQREYIDQLERALDDKSFSSASFFLTALFKVVEHPDMYRPDFVKWSVENIESALIAFSENSGGDKEEKNKDNEKAE